MRDMNRRVRTSFVAGLLSVMGFLCGATQVAAQTCVAPPPGLIAWWAGEGNAADKWDGNDGTIVEPVAFENGEVADAFDFEEVDASIGYVQVPHSASLTFNGSYTIELWMQTEGSVDGVPTLLDKYEPPDRHGYPFVVRLNKDSGTISCAAYDGSNVPSVTSSLNMPVDDNEFHHVACVYDYDGDPKSVTIYIDGQENNSADVASTLGDVNNEDDIFFGTRADRTDTDFDGLLDEISLYSRALTPSEIEGIYQAGTDGKCLPPMLIENLIEDVRELALPGNAGQSQLETALDALAEDPPDIQGAIDALQAFINYVNAQSGKKIPFGDADDLIDAAQAIVDLLG